jgi:predicted extracellular nuclease
VIKKLSPYILFLLSLPIFGQEDGFKLYEDAINTPRSEQDFRVAFYNCENLFDLKDDSLKRDEDFTPEGSYKYTYDRYKKKSNGIAKTIAALGGWRPAEVVGLCEVENYWVLEGLTKYSPIENIGYKIIHQESPDRRGIDIACIYDPERFNLILYKYYRIRFPFDPERTTRDILYVKGIAANTDTLHIFFNHWPSRYGGQFASEPSRNFVADFLKSKVDSLNNRFSNPLITIAGDFNDEPDDLSMAEHLQVKRPTDSFKSGDLINLMFPVKYNYGTHSYAGEWGVLDQFIVSGSLLKSQASIKTEADWVGIFNAPWLLKKNAANNDVPHRTFQGPAYKGGYSDHLPIFLDLRIVEKQKSAP